LGSENDIVLEKGMQILFWRFLAGSIDDRGTRMAMKADLAKEETSREDNVKRH
jgi:hypothetical protein